MIAKAVIRNAITPRGLVNELVVVLYASVAAAEAFDVAEDMAELAVPLTCAADPEAAFDAEDKAELPRLPAWDAVPEAASESEDAAELPKLPA